MNTTKLKDRFNSMKLSRKILTGILFILIAMSAMAQTGDLTGKVIDKEYNDILPFANVVVKGTTNGTTTDFEGNYALKLEEGVYTIVFSFIGYETIEISEVTSRPTRPRPWMPA